MQLELNKGYVIPNPALASGLKNWLSFVADYGDATVRVAYWDAKGWHVLTKTVTAAGPDVSLGTFGTDTRKFSVQVTSVTTPNTIVGVEALSTLIPA